MFVSCACLMAAGFSNPVLCHFCSEDSRFCQILYDRSRQPWSSAGEGHHATVISQHPTGAEEALEGDRFLCQSMAVLQRPTPMPDLGNNVSPTVAMAKEFVADIFRRAKEAQGTTLMAEEAGNGLACLLDSAAAPHQGPLTSWDVGKSSGSCLHGIGDCSCTSAGAGSIYDLLSPSDSPVGNTELESQAAEPGYVNYTKLRYVMEPGDLSEAEDGEWRSSKQSLHMQVAGSAGMRSRAFSKSKARSVGFISKALPGTGMHSSPGMHNGANPLCSHAGVIRWEQASVMLTRTSHTFVPASAKRCTKYSIDHLGFCLLGFFFCSHLLWYPSSYKVLPWCSVAIRVIPTVLKE